jgi:hypothetical protein
VKGAQALDGHQDAGIQMVRPALEAPLRQITENAGVDGSGVAKRVREGDDMTFGFNAQTQENGDMFKFGVVDPAKVVRTALQDAASVAGLLVTTEAMIAKPSPLRGPMQTRVLGIPVPCIRSSLSLHGSVRLRRLGSCEAIFKRIRPAGRKFIRRRRRAPHHGEPGLQNHPARTEERRDALRAAKGRR